MTSSELDLSYAVDTRASLLMAQASAARVRGGPSPGAQVRDDAGVDTANAAGPDRQGTAYRGWARDLDQARALQDGLRPGPGAVLARVRYVHLDYDRENAAPHLLGVGGPREITDPRELARPSWRRRGPDAVDLGVQLDLSDGRSLSVSWDNNSSDHEGLGAAWTTFADGGWLSADAAVAIWDVAETSVHWRGVVGSALLRVELGFLADEHGLHCHHLTLTFPSAPIHITLGDYVDEDSITSIGDNLLIYRL